MNKTTLKRTAIILSSVFAFVGMSAVFLYKSKETKAISPRQTVTILEIEPGNSFKLSESTTATSGTETLKTKYNDKTVTVDHLTMAEYISKVDQINGKYDIVVLGNYQKGYTAPFSTKAGYLPFGKELKNGLSNSTYGVANDTKVNKDGKTYFESFSENDITNKRAAEIKEMIQSGQLVYIDNGALAITGSKIASNFSSLTKANLIKANTADITIANVINKYDSLDTSGNKAKQRPVLSFKTAKPVDNERNMNFGFELLTEDNNPIYVNLYLDLNGDSLYKDKELVKNIDITPESKYVNSSLNYVVPNNFVGQLTWKLEVVTQDKVKVYDTGVVYYSSTVDNKPTVRVLQVYPDGLGDSKLDLKTDAEMKSLLTQVKEYNVLIESMSCTSFKTAINNWMATHSQDDRYLNGRYDMIIFGFADSYNNSDLDPNSINEVKNFISTGQSVMFTHDTFTYRIYPNIDTTDKSAKNMTQAFRDVAGQSRYIDPFNSGEMDVYKRYDVLTGTYVDRKITHDVSSNANKVTFGYSTGILNMFMSSPTAGSYSGESNSVYKINSGQINQYPFSLGDIAVAPTHYQWYQLNLEDEDVVPWYTLKPNGNGYNQYDARNYYYIYSKGNITYSGTGHRNAGSDYRTDEKKLFINTMIKASRGANHAPVITVKNLNDGDYLSKNQESIKFTVIPTDIDNDKLDTTITIKNSSGAVIGQPIKFVSKSQGTPLEVTLDSNVYNFKTLDSLTVEIESYDPQKAKGEKTVNVKLVNDPTISLSNSKDKSGYLKGDTANVTLKATANASGQNSQIKNIVFTPNQLSTVDYEITPSEAVKFNDVIFSPNPSVGEQSKIINVKLKTEGNIDIKGKLTYEYMLPDKTFKTVTKEYVITLGVKTGKINVSVLGDNNQLLKIPVEIEVISPDTKIPNLITLNNEVKSYDDLISGSYTFKIKVPNGYVSIAQSTITYDLGYDNPTYDVVFRVSQSPTLKLTYTFNEGYLRGDTANVGIKVEGVQGGSSGLISDIKLELEGNDAATVEGADTITKKALVQFNNIKFSPSPDSSGENKNIKVKLEKVATTSGAGTVKVIGKLTYKVTIGDNRQTIVIDNPIIFNVKSGLVKATLNIEDNGADSPYLEENVTVLLKDEGGNVTKKTISIGSISCVFENLNSQKYTAELQLETGSRYKVDSITQKEVSVSYLENEKEVILDTKIARLEHGIYLNGGIEEINSRELTKGGYAILAFKVEVSANIPDLKLILQDNITCKAEDITVYKVNAGSTNVKITDPSTVEEIKGTNGFKFNLPDTGKRTYMVVYKVKFSDEEGVSSYESTVKLRGESDTLTIPVREAPDLF